MKISETSNRMPSELNRPKKATRKGKGNATAAAVAAPSQADFGQALSDTSVQKIKLDLDELMKKLSEQGERLVKSQNFQEMESYKKLVQAFLDKLVNQLYHLQPAGNAEPSQRVHVLLQKVDLELEKLAKEVLSRQGSALKILEKLDQIRGLLLDMYK